MPRDDHAPTARTAALPVTGTLDRGELQRQLAFGRCLAWLSPLPAPRVGAVVPPGVRSLGAAGAPAGLVVDLVRHPEVRVRRAAVPEACLEVAEDHLALLLPSTPELLDVSRTPARLRWSAADELTLAPGSDRARVWLGLRALTGSAATALVPPWSAVAVGPVVLWYLPVGLEDALPRLRGLEPGAQVGAPGGFVAPSAASAHLVAEVRRLASRRSPAPPLPGVEAWDHGEPFLLTGETGVGKNLLAQAALPSGPAPAFAMVQPEEVRGWIDLTAFYGARGLAHDGQRVRDRPGRLEVLRHPAGVLLFDEIHSLDDEFRYRLVELLTYWTFRPRGDEGTPVPIRGLPLFATSRVEEVRDPARFPPDLFYRMGGEASLLEVPPLRTRRWEIPALAAHLLGRGVPGAAPALDADVRRKLLLHDWPGNVRELEQVLREAASRAGAGGRLTPEHLEVRPAGRGPSPVGRGGSPGHRDALRGPAPPPEDRQADAIEASGLPTSPPGAPGLPTSPPGAPGLRVPARPRWTDLVVLRAQLPDLDAVREALVEDRRRRGRRGANRGAVSRELGRLVRCDAGMEPGCAQSLCCRLADLAPGAFLGELATLLRESGVETSRVHGAIAVALLELVVERLGRQIPGLAPAAAPLHAAAHGQDPARALEAAVATLRGALRAQ